MLVLSFLMVSLYDMNEREVRSMIRTGLNTKDYVAPTSFVFRDRNTFQMGNTIGAVSYLQILAPELTDKMLAEFLDIDKNLIVNLHVQSVDQMKASRSFLRYSDREIEKQVAP